MSSVVAVVGAAGFIGNRTVEMLHLDGSHTVRPIVRQFSSMALAKRFKIDAMIADATDEAALTKAFDKCTHVVHAVAGDPATIVGSIEPIYRAAEAARVERLVYLSSSAVHGQSPSPGTDEDSALNDRQSLAYNNAKVTAERLLHQLRHKGRVEIVILRPGIVHGPRSQWVGGFADELLQGSAYLVEGGKGICNSTYVDNVVHAITLALHASAADGQAYLLGDEETVTWADLYGPIAHALGFDLRTISVPCPTVRIVEPDIRRRGAIAGMLKLLPARVRRTLRAAYSEWSQGRMSPSSTSDRAISRERMELHTCTVRLPFNKAADHLGYAPIVSFETACQNSVSWLDFAGYPVLSDDPSRRKQAGYD